MKRKVNRVGQSTLTVSLPSKWARMNNLNKGDEIELTEIDNRLVVSTKGKSVLRQAVVDVTNQKNMMRRIITALYKAGYDELIVSYSNSDELKLVQENVERHLADFDVVDYKQNKLKIVAISKLETEQFETVFRRSFYSINNIAADAYVAASNGNHDELMSIVLRDKNVDKYTDYCRRFLNKNNDAGFRLPHCMYYIIEELEIIGDMYKELCVEIATKRLNPSATLLSFMSEVNKFFSFFAEITFKFDMD
jgi:phosphate uptake regulator